MRNAILALLGVILLFTWILTAEKQQSGRDPKLHWKGASAKNSGAIIPVRDPHLEGCYLGEFMEHPGSRVFLDFSAPHETSTRPLRYRFSFIEGGIKKRWEGTEASLLTLSPKPGSFTSYRIQISPAQILEIDFKEHEETCTGSLMGITPSLPSGNPGRSFALKRAADCRE
jgi:hypothetical protein